MVKRDNKVVMRVVFDKTCPKSTFLAHYAKKKFAKGLHHVGHRFIHVTLKCSVLRGMHSVQLFVRLPRSAEIIASVRSYDMYEAVDKLVPKFNYLVHKKLETKGRFQHASISEELLDERNRAA